jgi:hypothetical protein
MATLGNWEAIGQGLENVGSQCALDIENLTEQLDEYPELEVLYSAYADLLNETNARLASIHSVYHGIVE